MRTPWASSTSSGKTWALTRNDFPPLSYTRRSIISLPCTWSHARHFWLAIWNGCKSCFRWSMIFFLAHGFYPMRWMTCVPMLRRRPVDSGKRSLKTPNSFNKIRLIAMLRMMMWRNWPRIGRLEWSLPSHWVTLTKCTVMLTSQRPKSTRGTCLGARNPKTK